MKIAYFDCFSGIAGDMVLGSLLDAGLDLNVLAAGLKKLNLKGYELKKTRVKRGQISGTKFSVITKDSGRGNGHRPLNEILKLIEKSSLNTRVKKTASKIFDNIGKAEARIHGVTRKKDISFHELGDIDSIIDIVGASIAFDALGIDRIYSSPIRFGMTVINTRHGILPAPSPASIELLKGVPAAISDTDAELVTPTGAGILKTLSKGFGEMPQIHISAIGYGAGDKELPELPNMLRVIIGETSH